MDTGLDVQLDVDARSRWFVAEVLPHEPGLMQYLRRNWRDENDLDDLRQEVYARVFDAAATRMPENAQAFVVSVARNLLIDRARRSKVVAFETHADMEVVMTQTDELTPERHLSAWTELKLFRKALALLPARCQQVVRLRRIHGMSQRDVAAHMGITEDTVERQVSKGIRALAQTLERGAHDASEQRDAANRLRPLQRTQR